MALPLLGLLVTLSGPAFAAEPPAGWIVSSAASGWTDHEDGRLPKMLLRCGLPASPSQAPLVVLLPPPHAPALTAVLDAVMGISEASYERQRLTLEQQSGRTCFARRPSDEVILAELAKKPGAIGIIAPLAALPPGIIRLWPPPAESPPPAPPPPPAAPAPVTP